MASLQIIGIPQSTYTRIVRMVAHEKGAPYDLVVAPPHSPDVKAIHPAGKVPVMRHGQHEMFESSAIAHYIDSHFDGPALTPRDPRGDRMVEMWISYINTVTDPLLIRRYLFSYLFPKTPDKKPDRAAIDAMQEELAREIDVLDAALAKTGHLVGDKLTIADIYLLPILAYVRQTPEGGALIAKAKNLSAFFDRNAERESFKATVPPPPNPN
jgi:glutathione S-transferase